MDIVLARAVAFSSFEIAPGKGFRMVRFLGFAWISFLLITFSATPVGNRNEHRGVIVWNVGQGLWITAVEEDYCRHFDVGGERFAWGKIARLCRSKRNFIYLSHWDWDHIGALSRWPRSWETCIALPPIGKSSAGKMKLLSGFKSCPGTMNLSVWRGAQEYTSSKPGKNKRKDSNGLSQVVRYGDFLLPGDSPVNSEMHWKNLPWVPSARVLIMGHHGSRTSTSDELLQRLPGLKLAIASARYERYKHPHAEVVHRLKTHHIPLLRTEDWGNIWFEK
ncbi:ComEC/Rec2 family competence protein [Bdellovibrio sp. HCB288]|uniref:ComEC/Rec2 family competence protein n=1 Tax=Bdellovibrio sp. HCB288 TaxID=3394355 RepID=UPI0039B54792